MANVPTFDPNRIAGSKAEAHQEPGHRRHVRAGSTNKTITAAAALQHGVVTPKTETIVPDNLPLCPEKTFRDSHSHAPELMTFADIVAQSSNVGTITAYRRRPALQGPGRLRLRPQERGRPAGESPGSCATPRPGTAPTSGPTPSARAWP